MPVDRPANAIPARRRGWSAGLALAVCAATGLATARLAADPQPAAAGTPSVWSTNLLGGDASSFDRSSGGWTGGEHSAVRQVRSPAQAGAGALAVTNDWGATTTTSAASGGGPATWVGAVPGATYRASAWVRAAGASRAVVPVLQFLNASGAQVALVGGQGTRDDARSWVLTPAVVAVAPPSAAYVRVGETFHGVSARETHYIDTASLQLVAMATPALSGPLTTAGNQILDSRGDPVRLRGLVRDGMEVNAAYTPVTQSEVDQAHAWGANLIRLMVGPQHYVPGACGYQPSYPGAVDQAIRLITGDGMVALVDPVEYQAPCGGSRLQAPMAQASETIAFWKAVAARYANAPLVAFDLFNEPHNVPDTVWRWGGTVTVGSSTVPVAGMQQLYQAVRQAGADNLVVAEGNDYASRYPTTAPLDGFNVAYAAHAYTCPQTPPPRCSSPSPYDASTLLEPWVAPSRTVPVLLDEFGWPAPGDGRFMASAVNLAETEGWGWAAMGLNGGTVGQFDLLAGPPTTRLTGTYEPDPTAMPVAAGLALGR